MLKAALGAFCAAWLLLLAIAMSGHLAWDNRLLWGPPALLGMSAFLGLGGWDHPEHRAPLLLLGALSFGGLLVYAVFYVFLFGLVGH